MKTNDLLKKKMTKKQLKEYYSRDRSIVGQGRNLGSRYMAGPKDYRRNKNKQSLRKAFKDECFLFLPVSG